MGKFRVNTVADSHHNIIDSCEREGLAVRAMWGRLGVAQGKPKGRRQACKGPKQAPRPMFDGSDRKVKKVAA